MDIQRPGLLSESVSADEDWGWQADPSHFPGQ